MGTDVGSGVVVEVDPEHRHTSPHAGPGEAVTTTAMAAAPPSSGRS